MKGKKLTPRYLAGQIRKKGVATLASQCCQIAKHIILNKRLNFKKWGGGGFNSIFLLN
jgi:hypothetical protein